MTASDGLERALGALKRREHSSAEVERYLADRGVDAGERDEILATLTRTSLVDDRRFAEARASSLADRGAGDARIRFELARAGLDHELVEAAIEALPSETLRAERVVARRGPGPKTARYLAGKGFSEDVIHTVVAQSRDEPLG